MSFLSELHEHVRAARRFISAKQKSYPHEPKKYPRMPQIALAQPEALSALLTDTLARRRSAQAFGRAQMPLEMLAQILGHGMKIRADGHRPYPSGGGLYPLEVYFLSFDVDGLPRGAFHYRPDTHALEHLWDFAGKPGTFVNAATENAAGLFIFTALWQRSAQKYRDFAYYLSLIEAGHLCENFILLSSALDLGIRPLAAFNDDLVAQALDIDGVREQPVYAALIGSSAHP